MAIASKYDNKKVETLLTEMLVVLDKHQASTELSLMVLGNLTTNIINHNLSGEQRGLIAEKFAHVLLSSVDKE